MNLRTHTVDTPTYARVHVNKKQTLAGTYVKMQTNKYHIHSRAAVDAWSRSEVEEQVGEKKEEDISRC